MANMRICEKKIVVSQRSPGAALLCAPANRHVFTKNISIAGDQFNALPAKRVILRIPANHAKGVKHIVLAKSRRPLHHRVPMQNTAIAKLHAFANNGIRADLYTSAQLRVRCDRRLRMNFRLRHFADFSACTAGTRSTILHINVASAASWPFTVARPSSLQKSPRHEITFTSILN